MNLQAAQDTYHRLRIGRAIENFSRRRFEALFFETAAEAIEYFFSNLTPSDVVGYGGSDTVQQLGIRDRLSLGDVRFLDRSKFGHGYEEQLDIRRQTLSADVFIASSNAVSIAGALVNIDGDGNRVAGLSLGPRRVVLFLGRNKLTEDLDSAIYRARNVAAASLAIQLGKDTPCAKTGRCHDCASPDRICSNLSIIEHCNPPGRITLLFINEDLGL
ncbi:lactate utilization protein [Candidatus Bipolaricaulota bacterium]|nr:lactate utilization protein [Candidatus Bipolaricaulota bacterium]TFH08652.1 MAG: lactate utilization protein [Candidatus Atribacteria bacterium]